MAIKAPRLQDGKVPLPMIAGLSVQSWFGLLLPVSLALLKFVLKITANKNVIKGDLPRAFLSIPTDLIFMALSYGTSQVLKIALYISGTTAVAELVAGLLTSIAICVIVVALANGSERAFKDNKNFQSFGLSILSFIGAFGTLFASVYLASVA